MARYRLLDAGGVHDTQAPAHDISPLNYTEWQSYLAWLTAGNVPDLATPPPPIYATLAAERAEVLARLDALAIEKRGRFILTGVLGHDWYIGPGAVTVIAMCRAAGSVPAGFGLPDLSRVFVPLNLSQLDTLGDAVRDRILSINANFIALAAVVNASATPLSVNLLAGWP